LNAPLRVAQAGPHACEAARLAPSVAAAGGFVVPLFPIVEAFAP
jgi:hypothetical protein